MDEWFVYVLETSDGTLYCGVTNDLVKRVHAHNHTSRGAKYTRSRRPVALLAWMACVGKSAALQGEHRFKKLTRAKKLEALRDDPKWTIADGRVLPA